MMQFFLVAILMGCYFSASSFGALSPRSAVANRLTANKAKIGSACQELQAEARGYSVALDLVEDSKKVFDANPDDSTAAFFLELSLFVLESRRKRFEMAEQAAKKILSESQKAIQAAQNLRAVPPVDTEKE